MINTTDRDDSQFIEVVMRALCAAIQSYRPVEIYIVQIDHWFDHKWAAFSGKVLGALGVWKKTLTLSPFNPHRVVSQVHYETNSPGTNAYNLKPASPLHIDQWSDVNMQRLVHRVSKDGLFVWYSGETKSCDTASLMMYSVKNEETFDWYASFKKKTDGWKLYKAEGISRRELLTMLSSTPSAPTI